MTIITLLHTQHQQRHVVQFLFIAESRALVPSQNKKDITWAQDNFLLTYLYKLMSFLSLAFTAHILPVLVQSALEHVHC